LPAASLALPTLAPPTTLPTPAPTATPGSASRTTYRVKKGDSLSAIAARYKVRLKTLEDANPQIKNPDVLKIGQILVIPVP
jgi:morphogenetic protein associated with SpoVID